MEAGKRAEALRAKLNEKRVLLVTLPAEHAALLAVTVVELRAPSMRVSGEAFRANGFDTLAIAMSDMVWLPAGEAWPAEQLWPTPSDVGACSADMAKALNWLYEQALAFLQAGKEASPKG